MWFLCSVVVGKVSGDRCFVTHVGWGYLVRGVYEGFVRLVRCVEVVGTSEAVGVVLLWGVIGLFFALKVCGG